MTKEMSIFEKLEDYKNWDKLIKHCEVLEGLTDFEKERAKRAFQILSFKACQQSLET